MGHDLRGKSGNYFRASCWSWPAVLGFVREAINTSELELDTSDWSYNFVPGLNSAADCEALAAAVESLIADYRARGLERVHSDEGSPSGELLLSLISSAFPQDQVVTGMRGTDLAHVAEFAAFLRECGGEFMIG
jgi:hypothetical protein